jgi:hypothetical protein
LLAQQLGSATFSPLSAVELSQQENESTFEEKNGFEEKAEAETEEKEAKFRAALEQFMIELWQADAQKGIWQMVHSLEGSFPLLLAMEGPQAIVAIARVAANEGARWIQ